MTKILACRTVARPPRRGRRPDRSRDRADQRRDPRHDRPRDARVRAAAGGPLRARDPQRRGGGAAPVRRADPRSRRGPRLGPRGLRRARPRRAARRAGRSTRCRPPTGSARGWPGGGSPRPAAGPSSTPSRWPPRRGGLRLHRRALRRLGRGLRAGAGRGRGRAPPPPARAGRPAARASRRPTPADLPPPPAPRPGRAAPRGGAGLRGGDLARVAPPPAAGGAGDRVDGRLPAAARPRGPGPRRSLERAARRARLALGPTVGPPALAESWALACASAAPPRPERLPARACCGPTSTSASCSCSKRAIWPSGSPRGAWRPSTA